MPTFRFSEIIRNSPVTDPGFLAAIARFDDLIMVATMTGITTLEGEDYIVGLQQRVWTREEIAVLIQQLDICAITMLFWERLSASQGTGQDMIFREMLLEHSKTCDDCRSFVGFFRQMEEIVRDGEPHRTVDIS